MHMDVCEKPLNDVLTFHRVYVNNIVFEYESG